MQAISRKEFMTRTCPLSYDQAKKPIYLQSRNVWMRSFVAENEDWDESKFADRARILAKDYYEKVFAKSID